MLQDYQREDGVEIPKLLQPYMHGNTFLLFKNKLPLNLKPKGRESRNRKRPKVAGLCRVSLVRVECMDRSQSHKLVGTNDTQFRVRTKNLETFKF
ncbi:hypothetical protein FF1_010414 [Malus domestica]